MEFSGASEEELREYRSYRRRPGSIRLSAAVDFSAEARPVIGGVRVNGAQLLVSTIDINKIYTYIWRVYLSIYTPNCLLST